MPRIGVAVANERIQAALDGASGSGTLVDGSDSAAGSGSDAAGYSRDKTSAEDS